MLTTYKIRHISSRRAQGVTRPSHCTLEGILKFDSSESPHCVYNEWVAERIAKSLQVPVASGVLAPTSDGLAYASLQVASPGISLPEMLPAQAEKVAAAYPEAVAALVAFDMFIGNWDRARNLKASLVTPHIPIFCAYDHSHALLSVAPDPKDSVEQLKRGDLIVKSHVFYGLVKADLLYRWLQHFAETSDHQVTGCCSIGKPFRAVSEDLQAGIAAALNARKRLLSGVLSNHLQTIRPVV